MRRVVVTGMGFVSPLGDDKERLIANLQAGHSAVGEITLFDTTDFKVKHACECKDFEPEVYFDPKEIKRLDRVNMFGIVAARKALQDSGLQLKDYAPHRVCAHIASGIGGLNTIEAEATKGALKGYRRISPFFIPMSIANMTAAHIAIDLGIHGYVGCPVTACAASNNALLDAYNSICYDDADIAFAGGSEASINQLGIGGFAAMRALSVSTDPNRSSIPFDKERDGFVMGEGSAVLILEEREQALARGAHIYGEIIGGAMTCDANHITAPSPEGEWAAQAMNMAMKRGNVEPHEVDYINAHGTSTPLNDAIETKAIRAALGDAADSVHVSSSKSMTGHLLGASGALEAIITLLAMQEGFVPPTVNYQVSDEACDLNITPNQAVKKDIFVAMSNALGFGGHNVSILFQKGDNTHV